MTDSEIAKAAENITMLFVKERFELPISREPNKEIFDVRKAVDIAQYYNLVYKTVKSTLEQNQ